MNPILFILFAVSTAATIALYISANRTQQRELQLQRVLLLISQSGPESTALAKLTLWTVYGYSSEK